MKHTAHLCLALVMLALVGLTSCTKTLLDYTITGVSLSKVQFDPASDYAAYTADRNFYYVRAFIEPVHTKRTFAYSGRPYPNGCAEEVHSVNFRSAYEGQNLNDYFGPMPVLDGRLDRMQLGQEGKPSVLVFHYDQVAKLVEALQTGYDPRCIYLLSTPKDAPQPTSVSIYQGWDFLPSAACGLLPNVRIDDLIYVDPKGMDHSAPKVAGKTQQAPQAADITAAEVAAVNAAVERIYGDVCAHPNVHAELYSRATEQYCTTDFKALLTKALKAHPKDEDGPLNYDYWLITQEDPQASFKVTEITASPERGKCLVTVFLYDAGQLYNNVTLVMKQEGGAWKIDDFVVIGPGADVSIRNTLNRYIKRK